MDNFGKRTLWFVQMIENEVMFLLLQAICVIMWMILGNWNILNQRMDSDSCCFSETISENIFCSWSKSVSISGDEYFVLNNSIYFKLYGRNTKLCVCVGAGALPTEPHLKCGVRWRSQHSLKPLPQGLDTLRPVLFRHFAWELMSIKWMIHHDN